MFGGTVARAIDVMHLGRDRVICAYELDGLIVDPGPATCVETLLNALDPVEPRGLLLTHIHLDHGGAAGVLVRMNPALTVHVSEIGAPHLLDPTRLERSARRLYGDDFDRLWGELAPIPEANVRIVGERVLDFDAFPTPGHASHHVSYLAPDGACYSGDATGVRIPPATYLAPVAPPPDIDLAAWGRTLDAIEARRPERLCLPHFGVIDDPVTHIAEMRARLRVWSERVREGADEEGFVAAAERELAESVADPELAESYRSAAPFWQSHAGLKRYWEKLT
jgi:glyoxylase-like metal-dependent hydrolase (beta-lactamase superfamily II)